MIAPNQTGPFDIIGDVHGCYPELVELLGLLHYEIAWENEKAKMVTHPENRRLIFVGDFVDRGPDSPAVLKLVMRLLELEIAFAVIGNHDDKLMRKLAGRNVQINHGLDITLDQLKPEPKIFHQHVHDFLESLPYYLWFDNYNLLVAHAGLQEKYHGEKGKQIRELTMFGPTTGKLDEYGLPKRILWAKDYKGNPFIVYGHTPVREPLFLNNTVNLDTGCVFGGKLTALQYPEIKIISVPCKEMYAEPRRPF